MDQKESTRVAMDRVAKLLAAELRVPHERIQIEQPLNMPPYSSNEPHRRMRLFEDGPILLFGAVNCPTMWQVDLLSRDDAADRLAAQVKSALQAVAWQLDQPDNHGLQLSAMGFSFSLGGTTPQPSGRLRITKVASPVNVSERNSSLRRYAYTLIVELPAIAAFLADDSKALEQSQKPIQKRIPGRKRKNDPA